MTELTHEADLDHAHPEHEGTGSKTASWGCGYSSALSSSSSGPDLQLPALLQAARLPAALPGGDLRHPLHLGELIRAADELAHHGVGPQRPEPASQRDTDLAVRDGRSWCGVPRWPGLRVHDVHRRRRHEDEHQPRRLSLLSAHRISRTHVAIGVIMLLSLWGSPEDGAS